VNNRPAQAPTPKNDPDRPKVDRSREEADMKLKVSKREFHTILAALRQRQFILGKIPQAAEAFTPSVELPAIWARSNP
jgi:hypothetical protein